MLGGATIQAMIKSIKDNARSKRNRYDKNKNYDTSKIPIYKRPITSRKLTQKEKNIVRDRLKKQRTIRSIKVISTIVIIVTIIAFYFYF